MLCVLWDVLCVLQKKFIKENASRIKQFGMLSKWDDSKAFLLDHPELCCEETANLLVIECLNHEMEEVISLTV